MNNSIISKLFVKNRIFIFLIALTILAIGPVWAQKMSPPPSIKKFDWLIGQWQFKDSSVDGSYSETGTRTCSYTLNDNYIVCNSHGTSGKGKVRDYLFYINYNHMDNRFEMTAMFGDYSRKSLYIIETDESGYNLRLTHLAWTADGISPMNKATISYDGKHQYIWKIRTGDPDPQSGEIPVGYIDTVTRSSK